eukprot:4857160-Amphidinium_carterae.1
MWCSGNAVVGDCKQSTLTLQVTVEGAIASQSHPFFEQFHHLRDCHQGTFRVPLVKTHGTIELVGSPEKLFFGLSRRHASVVCCGCLPQERHASLPPILR